MAPLERFFVLEVEFHRRLRTVAADAAEVSALHTSYALQLGYEPLLRSLGRVTARDIERAGGAVGAGQRRPRCAGGT